MAKSKKTPKFKISLRKDPKQKRSLDLVGSVLDAATRILEKAGVDAATTNKIAEKAGVSIGSLYQYFPNKDTIFYKLVEKQMEENALKFKRAIEEQKDKSIESLIEILSDDLVDLFFEKRLFMSALFSEIPKLKKTQDIIFRRNKMIQIFVDHLEEHKPLLRQPDKIEESVYVISHAVVGVLQTAALEDFKSHPPEALRTQLKILISSYLTKE